MHLYRPSSRDLLYKDTNSFKIKTWKKDILCKNYNKAILATLILDKRDFKTKYYIKGNKRGSILER